MAWIDEDRRRLWYGGQKMEQLPRLRGRANYRVSYRHIIDWLVRKPGAFASYRYREHPFPKHQVPDDLNLLRQLMPNRCDRPYLKILELAARQGEARMDDALRLLLTSESGKQTIADADAFDRFLKGCEQAPAIIDVAIAEMSLISFDQLLSMPSGVQ